MFVCNIAVKCYECPESDKGCNEGAAANNDTISICPIGEPGVGCWVNINSSQRRVSGATENARHKNPAQEMQGWKMQEKSVWKANRQSIA